MTIAIFPARAVGRKGDVVGCVGVDDDMMC